MLRSIGTLALVCSVGAVGAQTAAEKKAAESFLKRTLKVQFERPGSTAVSRVFDGNVFFAGAGWPNATGEIESWSESAIFMVKGEQLIVIPELGWGSEGFDLKQLVKPDFKLSKASDAKAFLRALEVVAAPPEIALGGGVARQENGWLLAASQLRGGAGFVVKTDDSGAIQSIRQTDSQEISAKLARPGIVSAAVKKKIRAHFHGRIEANIQAVKLGDAAGIIEGKLVGVSPVFKSGDGVTARMEGYEFALHIAGRKVTRMEDVQSVNNRKETPGVTALLKPGFKLKTDADAAKLEKLFDAVFPIPRHEAGDVKAVRKVGSGWRFVRGKFFRDEKGFVATTAADGAVESIVYHLKLPKK